jgi:RNA polymerase sigma-70 factor (ECF subfamily)
VSATSPDPTIWLDQHGDYLFRFALVRLRDEALAEDAVQETLLAALKGADGFSGRSSERTWLVGILKHKLIDHFRRSSRELAVGIAADEGSEHEEFYMSGGEWPDHWEPAFSPAGWRLTPESALERAEFWELFESCLGNLSDRLAQAFTLREVDGMSCDEICDVLNVSTSNLWVMLHRARLQLRRCVGVGWFGEGAAQ